MLKAKEVVLDSLWRIFLTALLPHKIAESFRKLLVTVTQVNSSGDPLKAANGVSCTGPFLEQLHALLESLGVSFDTNRQLNSAKSSASMEKLNHLFAGGTVSLLAGRECFEDFAIVPATAGNAGGYPWYRYNQKPANLPGR